MNLNKLKFSIFDFFIENKTHIIVFCSLFFVGTLTGIITLSQLTGIYEIDKISDIVLRQSITGNVGFFSYLFKRFFDIIICMTFCFLLSLNFYSNLVNYVVIFYKGYTLGATITLSILLLGLGGAINIIIFYIPFQLVTGFILICFFSCSSNFAFNKHRYGKCYKIDYNYLWLFCLVMFIICLCEAIFLPPLLKSIVYVA